MALAQEPSPTEMGGEELETERKSRPSRARKAAVDEGRLARMVRELRDFEDDIVAKLVAADRLLGQLEARRVHEDGGYGSRSEFEQRMLAHTPNLSAMREAIPTASSARLKVTDPRRESIDARTRQTRALTSIARTLEKLRGLDAEIGRCAAASSSQLRTIERMRTYEECGYASFEEFLERALGPSPVLASVLALVPNGTLADEEPSAAEQAQSAQDGEPSPSPDADPDYPAALFGASSLAGDSPESIFGAAPPPFEGAAAQAEDTPSALEPGSTEGGAEGDDAPVAASDAPNRRRRFATVIISVLLSAAAAIIGAAAGNWSAAPAAAPSATEQPAHAAANPSPAPAKTVTKVPAQRETPRIEQEDRKGGRNEP